MGIFNGKSQITWRRFSRDEAPLDASFLGKAIDAAISRRPKAHAQRVIWSESDSLPGLTVDRYGRILVVQISTLGMDLQSETLLDLLVRKLEPTQVVLRNDAPVRKLEGLPSEVRQVHGPKLEAGWLKLGAAEFWCDLLQGQKTGMFLDQIGHYQSVAQLAAGRRVLDGCCYQGGFALHCALAGASEVVAVDYSAEAITTARRNGEHNKCGIGWVNANLFDYLRESSSQQWDLVILDPPPFAKKKEDLAGARRGYKELNLRAFQQLKPGGLLATFSCSHHLSYDLFAELLRDAAGDAGRRVTLLRRLEQPADHPVLMTMPESEYLRGFLLGVE
jgi:23S rRNA (cytosine1962-C5)-methyltransferase